MSLQRALRLMLSLILVFSLSLSAASAQDDSEAKADPQAPAAAAGEATAQFQKLNEEWKTILKDLRKLKLTYESAKPEEAKQLEQQWQELIEQGNALLPQLRASGIEAYSEGSAVDPQLQRFLIKVAQDAQEVDDYESAYDISTTILKRSEADKAPAPKELYSIAGVSAFMTNDFEAAEKYIEQAKQAGTWNDAEVNKIGIPIAASLAKYKDWWAKEADIRKQEAEQDDLPRVKLSTTAGDMVIELFENEAPDTVGNFVSLVEAKFYDGLTFHRVLPHFMAQGGDPKGTGQGDPGYKIYDEVDNPNHRRHFRGSLSMAKGNFPDSGGSQFFICFTPRENLDGLHTVFGRVIEGKDVLSKIQRVDPEKTSSVEKTKIVTAEVIRKRDHNYLPRKVE